MGSSKDTDNQKMTWINQYAALGPAFTAEVLPTPVPAPYWVAQNPSFLKACGLPDAWLDTEEALAVFSGNGLWEGMAPRASVYSGHQFGHWAGQLGDGRALSLGEFATPQGSFEIQLKGAGQTPFSRMGDGRAVLRSSIREYLCSEAMAGLGVPTTRALCLTGTSLPVLREELETAAIVTRVAPSFIRFGNFEIFTARNDIANLDEYYEDCVIGGIGAFSIPIRDPSQFAEATRTKLVLEIALAPVLKPWNEGATVTLAQRREPRVSCMVGESLWRNRWGN